MADKQLNTEKNIPGKNECPGCSPFFTCGTCVGFIISKEIVIKVPVVFENSIREYPTYQQPATQNIPLSIWLPPKLS